MSRLTTMPDDRPFAWTFLTNHAQVLVCIARDPGVRLWEIGATVGITERAAHRIVTELADAGYITRERSGRRNRYTINAHFPVPDPVARERSVGELLTLLAARRDAGGPDAAGTGVADAAGADTDGADVTGADASA